MKSYTIAILFCFCFSLTNAQTLFENKAFDLGINITGTTSTQLGGVSFYDYDKDGWDDITFASKENFPVRFFKNNAGTFVEETFNITIPNHSKQVLWVDYDNDGDNDLFVTRFDASNKLYNNDGNFNFTDVSLIAGFPNTTLFTYGASFGDYDNDGDLDLFLSNKDDSKVIPNQLYRNNGNGTFTDVSLIAGISSVGHLSFCSAFFDYDNDGFLDIYISNDRFANTNILYKNNGNGTFTDVSAASGAGVAANAMSTTIDDYNYDGFLDIYVTNTTEGNHLLQNNGDGTFTDVATSTGTNFNSIGWGANFFDADNDSDLDLYVSSMINDPNSPLLTSGFYECGSGYNYTIPASAGFSTDTFTSFSNAIGDINNDGYQDFVVANQAPENYALWRSTGGTNNWLKVKLDGTSSNKAGIGAKIKATVNGQASYRYVLCGEAFLGQNSATEIFGIGTATTIDMLEVFWPSGITDTYTNVTSNQLLTVTEGSTLGINEENAEKFSVYPNPASDYIVVSTTFLQPYTVTIFDSLGKQVLVQKEQNIQAIIDVSNISSGIFFLEIRTKKSKTVQKVVIH